MKKIKTLIVTTVLAFSMAATPITAFAYTDLFIPKDEVVRDDGYIDEGGKETYYITVEKSGYYIMRTVSQYTDFDTRATLIDLDSDDEWSDDDSGNGTNFEIRAYLKKGHEYKLRVYGFDDEEYGDFRLKIYRD